jgi:amidase
MTTDRRSFLTAAGSALAFGAPGNAAASTDAAEAASAATSGQAKTPPAGDLCYASARELARLMQSGQLSAREVMAAHLKQMAHWNPTVNAIVAKLDDDRCMALADAADRQRKVRGPLHGLPIAIKDTEPAVGFPFTRGSPIFRNEMPGEDSVIVERLRSAGAIFIGKTNVPEFGMGSHTYNKVYGTTLNAYDPTKSAGGSSGGAGVALATGMLPIVNGSDLGGSPNPGNFNNVVGFRPTMGPFRRHR